MINVEQKRECGDCTMCCEGHLTGEVYGKKYWRGKPCHFLTIGKGCNIYKDRPKENCKDYSCAWIKDTNIPYWMKPNQVDAIVDWKNSKNGNKYLRVIEGKKPLKSKVLHWVIQYCFENGYNLMYDYKKVSYYIGTQNFINEFQPRISSR